MDWVFCERNVFPVGWHLRGHSHGDVHELVLVLEGSLATCMDDRDYVAGPGTLMLHPAGTEHAESARGGRPLSTLYLAWKKTSENELAGLPLPISDRTGRIEAALRWLIDLLAQGTTASANASLGLVTALLHDVRNSAITPEERMVATVRTFAQSRLSSALTLADLARVSGMSSSHFSRTFLRTTGCSPMQYLRQLRMQRARHLLLTSEVMISEVAALVGYTDPLHFSRVFRQCSGLAPGRMRRSVRDR